MKRVLLLFCMVMLIFGLLCGCGGAPAGPTNPTPDPGDPTPGTDDPGTSSEVLEHMWELIGSESDFSLVRTDPPIASTIPLPDRNLFPGRKCEDDKEPCFQPGIR